MFNNPVSVTNDNDKIQVAKGPSNISAEIKQTVKNTRIKIESGSDAVLSNVSSIVCEVNKMVTFFL